MLLWILMGVSALIGLLVVIFTSKGNGRFSPGAGTLTALVLFALSFVISFLTVLQGDRITDVRDKLQSREVSSLRYAESSSRRGDLIGNYTFNYEQIDGDGRTFLKQGSVPTASTRLYIDRELKETIFEEYQDYFWDPAVFPWPVYSFQNYEIHTPVDPKR